MPQIQAIAQNLAQLSPTPHVKVINYRDMGPHQNPGPQYDQYSSNREFYDTAGDPSFNKYSHSLYNENSQFELNDVNTYQNLQRDNLYKKYLNNDVFSYFTQSHTSFACKICQFSFSFRNKLFKHIRQMGHQKKPVLSHDKLVTNIFANMGTSSEIICSNAPSIKDDRLAFRDYNYLK